MTVVRLPMIETGALIRPFPRRHTKTFFFLLASVLMHERMYQPVREHYNMNQNVLKCSRGLKALALC